MKAYQKIRNYYDYLDLYFTSPITFKRGEELNLRPIYTLDPYNQEEKTKYYKYKFPLIFWTKKDGIKIPTLFCELTINTFDWKVMVDVKKPSGETYAYFYCTEITKENKNKHKLLIQIHKTIHEELDKLGIIHRKNEIKERGKINANETGSKKIRSSKMGYPSTAR